MVDVRIINMSLAIEQNILFLDLWREPGVLWSCKKDEARILATLNLLSLFNLIPTELVRRLSREIGASCGGKNSNGIR